MAELRYNPISGEWVMVASHRQNRPQMPKNWCPFCKGSDKVPSEGFTVMRYPNDFPALSTTPPPVDDVATQLFKTAPAYGKCEVLLYSDQHSITLKELPDAHVHKLSHMWREVFDDMAADAKIKYVYIFENRGEPVGVTMPHPHGQAYGYSFIPKKLESELTNSSEYYNKNNKCLFCDVLAEEIKEDKRMIFSNKHFAVFVPFFSPITYGVHVMAKRHVSSIGEMSTEELNSLGEIVKDCAGMYDNLFNMEFPYMMCMHNAPVNSGNYKKSYHFHIEYFPPMRTADKQQFFASSETGAGAWCNPNCPETIAEHLKEAYKKFKG